MSQAAETPTTPRKKIPPMAVGQRHGRLVAVEPVTQDKWRFLCDCGTERVAITTNVRFGRTQSCGCLQRERASKANRPNKTHGLSSSLEHQTWGAMLNRCRDPKHQSFKYYGGRGIIACERWQSFANFYADMGPRPTPNHSIDRIDNDGPYSPENCRWTTQKEQTRHKRGNRMVVYGGKEMTLAEACENSAIRYDTVRYRLSIGWSIDRALTEPVSDPIPRP